MKKPAISFELFPPKTDQARENLEREVRILATLNPAFMTVTFGAGGSNRAGTKDTALRVQDITGIPVAAHLTFIGLTKRELDDYVTDLTRAGIRHIIALRGDMPKGQVIPDPANPDYYKTTNEFVAALKKRGDIEISVGTYPEKHPQSVSLEADIEALRQKDAAGADRAITQFFFENDIFFNFVNQVKKSGIGLPVAAGILPILNFEKMLSFAQTCQARVPDWLHARFKGVSDEQAVHRLAADILTEQVKGLAQGGATHLHFYTLNKADLTLRACQNSGLAV